MKKLKYFNIAFSFLFIHIYLILLENIHPFVRLIYMSELPTLQQWGRVTGIEGHKISFLLRLVEPEFICWFGYKY